MRLRGRFIARKTSVPGLTMIFGYAKDLELKSENGHDLVFAADLDGYCEHRECKETWNKSPEDVLEQGIPTLRQTMNPIRELLNKWRYSGKLKLSIRVNNHTNHGVIVEGTDIKDINPNGFTTYESDFEIPYHRVLIILEEQNDGSWQNLYTKRSSWKE